MAASEPSSIQSAGFIGLGNIGKPMAERLLQGSFAVSIFDIVPDAVAELESLGAQGAADPAELAASCDYIGLCVRDDNDVSSLLYGEQGLLAHAKPHTIIAVHSTVTQANLLRWAEDASKHSVVLLDAPMTGGQQGAVDGTLCYMLGGDSETVDACRPVLETSAEKIIHAGKLGAGLALKLCNNLITYAEFTAMSEATRLAEACGLDADVLREVGKSNGVINEQMHRFVSGKNALAASVSNEEMEKFFGAMGRLGAKDLDCALATAEAHGIQMPSTAFVRNIIEDVFLAKA